MEGAIIAGNGKKNGKKKQRPRGKVSFRTAEIREIGRDLATLGLVRIRKGDKLNVRRREKLRRAFAEAGQPLRWNEVAALSEDPVDIAATDVKKMVRSGVKSLGKSLSEELADKRAEMTRLKRVVKQLRDIAEDPDTEYPVEVEYSRSARSSTEGYIVKTETLTLEDAEGALRASRKIEKSLPNWTKVRDEVVADLKRKQDRLEALTGNLSDLVESWRGLLKEVLITMR